MHLCECEYQIASHIFLLEILQWQTVGLMKSWSITSKAVVQQFDLGLDHFDAHEMLLGV